MPTYVNEILAADWSIKLNAPGEVVTGPEDIRQCIDVILNTPIGAVPLRADFGCAAHLELDRPFAEAIPMAKKHIFDAITRWETRAKVTAIAHEALETGLRFVVKWTTPEGAEGENRVTYAATRT